MIVSANLSQEVYHYFKDYNLSDVANALLAKYDFTCLPPTSGKRYKEIRVNITDPVYISLYGTVGPHSKKVSLGRLFEFAYYMDVLSSPDFSVEPTKNEDSPVPQLLNKAYRALLEAQQYTDNLIIKELTKMINDLKTVFDNEKQGGRKNG